MHKPPFIRSAYNYDVKEASDAATMPPEMNGESMTVQSMTEDADINVLMKRYGITGKFPENLRVPEYGDYSEITDFRGAWEAVRAAEENFMQMPAETRSKFQNDPQMFLDYCANPANLAEMRKMGLAVPEAVVVPATNPGTPPAAPEAKT